MKKFCLTVWLMLGFMYASSGLDLMAFEIDPANPGNHTQVSPAFDVTVSWNFTNYINSNTPNGLLSFWKLLPDQIDGDDYGLDLGCYEAGAGGGDDPGGSYGNGNPEGQGGEAEGYIFPNPAPRGKLIHFHTQGEADLPIVYDLQGNAYAPTNPVYSAGAWAFTLPDAPRGVYTLLHQGIGYTLLIQ